MPRARRRDSGGLTISAAHPAVEHRFHMNVYAIIAALGTLLIAGPASFILGRSRGQGSERQRQADAKATAEETSKRIIGDAEKDAENLRKSAVVTGKEEVIRLRETFEHEVRGRREEVER